MIAEFRNEPLVDFGIEANRRGMEEALSLVASRLGREYPLVIGGERVEASSTFDSLNPSDPKEIIGRFHKAGADEARRAIEAAEIAFEGWRWMPARERADLLFRASGILRRRRFEMNAWLIFEVGKSWTEADAETAEAIDFLEFYGREAIRYAQPQPLTPLPGEDNELKYIPLGVGAVIPPWNFPCAILLGMTAAAIVAGNTVVLKPSSDACAIAWAAFSILEEAGLPPGVVNFLPGGGATAGQLLVDHPRTRFIAFTGSKEVGLAINESAAKTRPGQIWIKRVIAEMGGKDFILVDGDADLDAAVEGVVTSAFGFQGQKCSACSRAIVHEKIYDRFLQALLKQVRGIRVGPTREPGNTMGPVVNAEAEKSILGYIELGGKEGRLVAGGAKAPRDGYFIEPTVIADVAPDARIAREEIFGPVLAVLKCRDLEEGIRIANSTEYGLTGSVYSRNRKHLRAAKRLCHVGNLYLNRNCTGAMVGGHPFGGFNMSGTDSKAGGRDYLMLFTQAKCVSEAF
jgi:1-pyrroline-5-carboxylate dehydrogenase